MEAFEESVAKFEEMGEFEVREQIAHGYIVEKKKGHALEWRRRKDQERAEARASLRDERESRTLAIAEEDNEIAARALDTSNIQASEAARAASAAERQARYAMYAAIAALILALIIIREDIEKFIDWILSCVAS
ncbi:hypothetical protein [Thiorhodococcus minor]|uniref:Uncharacterized protein n=1 Tax=Thiorhodococcus minor TaxID=57489 RepID=A0A6M0K9E6_9GAMM|nr:hypothetical protein [Thiorhodococcus minor]NEV65135.1 hypothetical protein [Thiorhodococcus minor]